MMWAPLVILVLFGLYLLSLNVDPDGKWILVLIYLAYPIVFVVQGLYYKAWKPLLVSTGLAALVVLLQPLYWDLDEPLKGLSVNLMPVVVYVFLSLSLFCVRKCLKK